MTVLVTGGAGYIGSHTAVLLLKQGYDVIIADNFSNSDISVIDRIEKLASKKPLLYIADICNKNEVEEIFKNNKIDAAIHFAGFKAVGESVSVPVSYYRNNLDSALTLLEVMMEHDCKKLVFSSSATVYGAKNPVPYTEDMETSATNPYGWTKVMVEQILRDAAAADSSWSIVSLRYFNPIGADESGLLGESPNGIPNNLMPNISAVAGKRQEYLRVFGNDYDTPDGTGIRDYIHVSDLAEGHIKALEYLENYHGCQEINLGTGFGTSVLELVGAFESVSGIKIPYVFEDRRAGDLAVCYASAKKAKDLLDWEAKRSVAKMCEDAWRWEKTCMDNNKENREE